MRIPRAILPNLITLAGVFCGFDAMVQIMDGRIPAAVWLIVLAGVLDILDGMAARLTRSIGRFGLELDSLADLVSFGVAPSLLVYQAYLKELGAAGIVVSSLPTLCGAFRLARFNLQADGKDKAHFVGLPIPPAAVALCSFVLLTGGAEGRLDGFGRAALPWLVAAVSALMASRVAYDSLPRPSLRGFMSEPLKTFLCALAIVSIAATSGRATLWVASFYVVSPLLHIALSPLRRLAAGRQRGVGAAPTEPGRRA